MGQSLTDAAVRGMSTHIIVTPEGESLAAGGIDELIAVKRSIFGDLKMMAREDDGDDDDSDDEDEDEDDADDDDDEDDDDEPKGRGRKLDRKDRRIQELSSESAKHRKRASERGRRIAELEAEIAKLNKGKPKGKKDDDEEDADEADDSELAAEREKNAKLAEQLVTQQLRMEFTDLITGPKAIAKFKNPKSAFKLLDLDDVEVDEDGEIIGLEDAIKALAKSDPYLVDTGKDDDEDDEDDDDELEKRRQRRTGQPPASKRKKGNPNRDKLMSKYPALRR